MDHYKQFKAAARDQGFVPPFDESPVDRPTGWYGGAVQQTGGWVLCRIWRTVDVPLSEYTGEDTVFECAYGEEKSVSILRYDWNDKGERYEMTNPGIQAVHVTPNTDKLKAAHAGTLMSHFGPEE
jgi:hypothetical protein